MQIRIADLIQEEGVMNGFKGLRDVDGDSSGAERWLWRIETSGDTIDSGQEGSGGGMSRTEAVLRRRRRKRRGNERKEAALKDFRGGTKKGDGAVRGGKEVIFTGLGDWED